MLPIEESALSENELVFENRIGNFKNEASASSRPLHVKWMNSKEAAEYLRTSVGSIRNMVYRGQLTPHKPFGRLLFSRRELDQIVATSRMGV